MAVAQPPQSTARLPDGYVAVPLHRSDSSPVRVCVIVRPTPDPAAGHLVLLRDLFDARAYLGCVTDAGGQVREWLELAVQNVDGLAESLPSLREAFSNHILDERWVQRVESVRTLNAGVLLETGWERTPPAATFLDPAQTTAIEPGATDAGGPWKLCRDDALLASAALPPYGTSLFRYLHQPGAGPQSKFVPVVAGAPENERTRPLAEVLGPAQNAVPFNPQGGLMLAGTFFPLGWEDYADLLGGKPWKGLEHGKKWFNFGGVYGTLADENELQQGGAHLFLGGQGRGGRFVETFHLKLQILTEAFRQVRAHIERQQLPLLNLAADSFRVKLEPVGAKLPYFWTARCALVKPSHAFALPVESGEFRYFLRARAAGASIYLPEDLGAPVQGSASVRIRKLQPMDQGRTILEGTLLSQDRLQASPHDLLWIRLPLPSGRIDLYGHLYAAEGLAQGEARFRTLPQALPPAAVTALAGAEGVAFPRAPFEIVPLHSSPCDLYSLAVLAVRTLLVDEKSSLAMALDEMLSLARRVAAEPNPDVPLGQRIRSLFDRDGRFMSALGPHHLRREGLDAAQAFQLLPAELWFDTLAVLVQLFPGVGPDSVCSSYGDVPALALETAFDRPLAALETLLLRSRSLILIDWTANREVHSVIRERLARLAG